MAIDSQKVVQMRTLTFGRYALSTVAIATLLAGCSGSTGSDTANASAFAPTTQTSGEHLTSDANIGESPSVKGVTCPIQNGDVPLASAASFAVLGGSAVTSAGLTILDGNLGVSPGTSITGFGPGVVKDGTTEAGTAVAAAAQADATTAYNYIVALKNPTQIPADIGGTTITPGLYNAATTLGITGTVTLDGQGKSNSVFIFQIPAALTAEANSQVRLAHKANACNVFWQVGSAATLDKSAHFKGTIMAAAGITVDSAVKVRGRLLAGSAGPVTMVDDLANSFYLADNLNHNR